MAMDKLQPIIKHHFWIVFLIAVLLPPIAWWMTTGDLAAEISERTSSLDSTFTGIANGQNAANEDWANGVNQLIAIRTQANRMALNRLWQAQTDLMVWPLVVAEYMNVCPYRGELEDVRMKQVLPAMYRDGYERDVRRVWHIPEPIDDGTTRVDAEAKQKVVFPYASLPRIPAAKWDGLPPTWQEIWNAQEDLWLLGEVLASVRRTNDSTSSITDSYVKQIMQVQLFGGQRATAPSSAGSTTSAAGYPGMSPGYPGMVSGMPGGAGRRGGTSALSKPAEFPVSEEYVVSSSGGDRGSSYMSGEGETSGSSPTTVSDPNSDESRYVQSEEAYRTRGFKLKVAIDQMQVPTLIRELLNSQYPIEVIRFQQSAMNPEEPGKPTSRNSGYPGGNSLAGMSSGYPGSGEEDYLGDSGDSSLETYTDDSFGFEGEGGADPGVDALSGKSYTVPAIANVQASLEDRDLVELVVIGEIYIYNPPAADESGVSPGDSGQMAGSATSPDALQVMDTGVDGPVVPASTTPATSVVPGNATAIPAASLEFDESVVPDTSASGESTVPEDAAATDATNESSPSDSSSATTDFAPPDAASPPNGTETP